MFQCVLERSKGVPGVSGLSRSVSALREFQNNQGHSKGFCQEPRSDIDFLSKLIADVLQEFIMTKKKMELVDSKACAH